MPQQKTGPSGPGFHGTPLDQPRSARAARVLRVPLVPLVAEVSVELVPLMVEPLVVPLVVALVESVALVVPVLPVPVVVDVVPVPEVLVDWSVAVEPVPKFELLVVAGVPVPEVVPCVPLVPCVAVFGPVPVALVPVLPEASEPLVCALTPTAATRAATAAAMVKLFGSLLIGFSCCRVKVRLLWFAACSAPLPMDGAPKDLANFLRASRVPKTPGRREGRGCGTLPEL